MVGRGVHLGNRTKPGLPLWTVSRLGGLAKGCSFHVVRFSGLQTRPFRRIGADRFVPRVRAGRVLLHVRARAPLNHAVNAHATERSHDPRRATGGSGGRRCSRWRSSRVQLLVPGNASREGLLARDQEESMLQRRAPKLRLGIARARENDQERAHRLHCLLTDSLAQACHVTSCTARTSHLWTLPVRKAQYCTTSSNLSAPDTLSDHLGYASQLRSPVLEARARPNCSTERRATHPPQS